MQALDVSVIIPTFNRLSLLPSALESVFLQDPAPREIIVVDDGSEDGTSEWLRDIARDGLLAVRQERAGPGPARNRGARLAGGKYLAFLDSDDRWLPGKLAAQVRFLKENPEYRVCQTEEIWIRDGKRVNAGRRHAKPSGWIFEECLKLCLISPSAVMIERDFFWDLGGFDPAFEVCEDYELWLRAALAGPVKTLPEALTVKTGGHADQLSKKHWGMDRFRAAALEKILTTCSLTAGQKTALLSELKGKLGILAAGFEKRNPGRDNPYRNQWLQLEKQTNVVPTAALPARCEG